MAGVNDPLARYAVFYLSASCTFHGQGQEVNLARLTILSQLSDDGIRGAVGKTVLDVPN